VTAQNLDQVNGIADIMVLPSVSPDRAAARPGVATSNESAASNSNVVTTPTIRVIAAANVPADSLTLSFDPLA
jgi:hypothetical protein